MLFPAGTSVFSSVSPDFGTGRLCSSSFFGSSVDTGPFWTDTSGLGHGPAYKQPVRHGAVFIDFLGSQGKSVVDEVYVPQKLYHQVTVPDLRFGDGDDAVIDKGYNG